MFKINFTTTLLTFGFWFSLASHAETTDEALCRAAKETSLAGVKAALAAGANPNTTCELSDEGWPSLSPLILGTHSNIGEHHLVEVDTLLGIGTALIEAGARADFINKIDSGTSQPIEETNLGLLLGQGAFPWELKLALEFSKHGVDPSDPKYKVFFLQNVVCASGRDDHLVMADILALIRSARQIKNHQNSDTYLRATLSCLRPFGGEAEKLAMDLLSSWDFKNDPVYKVGQYLALIMDKNPSLAMIKYLLSQGADAQHFTCTSARGWSCPKDYIGKSLLSAWLGAGDIALYGDATARLEIFRYLESLGGNFRDDFTTNDHEGWSRVYSLRDQDLLDAIEPHL